MSTLLNSSNKNPLILSQRFTSYIEKHRIFQLFQELSSMLLIKKPDDHVLFLKQSLCHAARRLDVPRIIIIAPQNYDKLQLAQMLQKKLNIPLITLNEIHDHPESITLSTSNVAIENLRMILINYMRMKCDGWLFLDFPRNEKEARFLLRSGILPTHVIEITTAEIPQPCEIPVNEYFKELRGLRHVFSNFLMKIDVDNCNIEDIFERCLTLIKCRKYSRAPTVMRILLIDTIDFERCRDLGRHIAEIFNVVCIHFSDIAEQVSLQDTVLGNKTREILDGDQPTLPPEVKTEIFEDFLSRSTAMKQGWVLTDFPCTVEDFKHLDMTDFPPNRVIMIVNNDNLAEEESISSTNQEDSIKQISITMSEILCGCPKEKKNKIDKKGIIKYAGKTATIIEEADDLKKMKEKIDFYLMQPPANAPPRIPRAPPCVRLEDIEYDPDDKPSIDELSEIRNQEPVLNLI